MKSEQKDIKAKKTHDVIIIGGGAAGLICAIEAGKRGRSVLLLEQNAEIGEKIRISGGGRCNFTNRETTAANFLSENEHFCKSALARFTSDDFIRMVEKHGILYHEKKLGQLFCDESSQQIIDMLLVECREANVQIMTECYNDSISRNKLFTVETNKGVFLSESLVIATGGLSIPKLGATSFGYRIAKQFGIDVTKVKPGLVPFLLSGDDLKAFKELSGISIDAVVRCNDTEFRENILFTHRGLSGPAILQISSYWDEGKQIVINLLPDEDAFELLKGHYQTNITINSVLEWRFPKRFVDAWCSLNKLPKSLTQYSLKELLAVAQKIHEWEVTPSGTEGFEKAEVTVGGVDTNELSSKTMEAKKIPGLFFIGEVVDVTGWLGGYNFQWAWSSGFVAGQNV